MLTNHLFCVFDRKSFWWWWDFEATKAVIHKQSWSWYAWLFYCLLFLILGCIAFSLLEYILLAALHEIDPTFKSFSCSAKSTGLLTSLGYKRPVVIQSMYIFKVCSCCNILVSIRNWFKIFDNIKIMHLFGVSFAMKGNAITVWKDFNILQLCLLNV